MIGAMVVLQLTGRPSLKVRQTFIKPLCRLLDSSHRQIRKKTRLSPSNGNEVRRQRQYANASTPNATAVGKVTEVKVTKFVTRFFTPLQQIT